LAIYEVANAVWKQEHLLKSVDDGLQYVGILYGLIDSGKITVIASNEKLLQESYQIAIRQGITIYDAIFIALALDLDLSLKTFDRAQTRALKSEDKK